MLTLVRPLRKGFTLEHLRAFSNHQSLSLTALPWAESLLGSQEISIRLVFLTYTDNLLPESLRTFLFTLFFLFSNFVLISVVFPWFLVPFFPMIVVFYYFQAFYRSSSRELRRLDSITRSPLVANISETLGGISTIRAYGVTELFQRKAFKLMNDNNK
jgi:ABC-type multidrug transport system fused ATPase/permease subunit